MHLFVQQSDLSSTKPQIFSSRLVRATTLSSCVTELLVCVGAKLTLRQLHGSSSFQE